MGRKPKSNSAPGPSIEAGDNSTETEKVVSGQNALEREEQREQEQILENMRQLGGAGSYLRIERKKPNEAEFAVIVPRAPLENYADATKLEEYLLSTFGGGDYKIQGRTSKGAIVKQYALKIDHSIPAKNPAEKLPEKKEDSAATVKEIIAGLVPLLKPAQPQDNSAMILAMLQSQTQMAIENAKAQSQMMTTMFTAMNSNRGPDPALQTLLNRIERTMEKLSDVQNSPKEKSGAAELLELLEVIDRVRDSAPEEKKGMFAQLGEALAPVVKQFAGAAPLTAAPSLEAGTNGAAAPASPRALPAAEAAGTVIETTATATTSPPPMNFFVQQALRTVAANALAQAEKTANLSAEAKQTAAEDFGQGIADQIPPAYEEQVEAALTDANWLAKFFNNDPRAQMHAAWLGQVRDVILAELAGEEQE